MSNWEQIDDTTKRLEVPGGWLYKIWTAGQSVSVVLVPVPPRATAMGYEQIIRIAREALGWYATLPADRAATPQMAQQALKAINELVGEK